MNGILELAAAPGIAGDALSHAAPDDVGRNAAPVLINAASSSSTDASEYLSFTNTLASPRGVYNPTDPSWHFRRSRPDLSASDSNFFNSHSCSRLDNLFDLSSASDRLLLSLANLFNSANNGSTVATSAPDGVAGPEANVRAAAPNALAGAKPGVAPVFGGVPEPDPLAGSKPLPGDLEPKPAPDDAALAPDPAVLELEPGRGALNGVDDAPDDADGDAPEDPVGVELGGLGADPGLDGVDDPADVELTSEPPAALVESLLVETLFAGSFLPVGDELPLYAAYASAAQATPVTIIPPPP